MNMTKETVTNLIGEAGAEWENMTAEEIHALSNTVVGGSTKKPTSAAKKEEALELGQVLGQFVNAAPGPVLKVMLQAMEKAFDEITISEEDWQELLVAIEGQQGGGEGQQGGAASGPDVASASPEQLKQILAQLPPEAKAEVQSAIESGVPPQKALQAVMSNTQQQQPAVPMQ